MNNLWRELSHTNILELLQMSELLLGLLIECCILKIHLLIPVLLRVTLSEVEVFGKFFVDNKVQVVSFVTNVSSYS